jgi:hypothetical protein
LCHSTPGSTTTGRDIAGEREVFEGGMGLLAERMVALGCRLTGVDFSAAMLRKARTRLASKRQRGGA